MAMGKGGRLLASTSALIVVSGVSDQVVEIIANEQGNRTTPVLIIWLSPTWSGSSATRPRTKVAMNPHNIVFFDTNCFIGRRFYDPFV